MIAQQNILDLLVRIKQGDQRAESSFVKKYEKRIFTIALHYISDKEDAEEITYETLTICIFNIKNDKLREPEKIGSYIYGVCWRLCMKRQRKKNRMINGEKIIHESLNNESKKRNLEKEIAEAYFHDDPQINLEKNEIKKMVREAVSKIKNKKYRQVLELILKGDSPKDIAEKLRIDINNLYIRSLRARNALGKILDIMRKEEI